MRATSTAPLLFPPGQPEPALTPRHQRGSALLITLVTLVALLGVGSAALLATLAEIRSAGRARASQAALYAAESGMATAMELLRSQCDPTSLFSSLVEPANANPQQPATILGNGIEPGQTGNAFSAATGEWYQVVVLNNGTDSGLAAGNDTDGILTLRITGFGPGGARTVLEMDVENSNCAQAACETELAQRAMTSRNDARAICSQRIAAGAALRTFNTP
ncbi:MAG: pilus assembly PilX N-terminal domain-containing protein [Pseudomonadota bacterium]